MSHAVPGPTLKPVWFEVINVLLYLDMSKGYVHRASGGRCHLHELMKLLEVYVLQGIHCIPLGISW
jgi:hypothetical protein